MAVYSDDWPHNELSKLSKLLFNFKFQSSKCHKADNLEKCNITLQPYRTSAITSRKSMKSTLTLIV